MIGPQVSGWLVRLFTEVESSAFPGLATAGIVGCRNMASAWSPSVRELGSLAPDGGSSVPWPFLKTHTVVPVL